MVILVKNSEMIPLETGKWHLISQDTSLKKGKGQGEGSKRACLGVQAALLMARRTSWEPSSRTLLHNIFWCPELVSEEMPPGSPGVWTKTQRVPGGNINWATVIYTDSAQAANKQSWKISAVSVLVGQNKVTVRGTPHPAEPADIRGHCQCWIRILMVLGILTRGWPRDGWQGPAAVAGKAEP